MDTKTRIGDFVFDSATGEPTRASTDGTAECCRLPPMPSKLLDLLIARSPDVVCRDEIQQTLWPDVLVDFDRNLHFCVRQVRTAL